MSNYKFFEEHNHQATQNIKKSYTDIISDIGEDVTREGIVKTPERASKAMQFLTQGYDQDPAPKTPKPQLREILRLKIDY